MKFKKGDFVIFKNILFLEGEIKDVYLVKIGLFRKKWFKEEELELL